ncbi:MAG: tetratricopeptide repeat protein [Alcanivoracaceae bacterium]
MTLMLALFVLAAAVLLLLLVWKRQAGASLGPVPLLAVALAVFAASLAGWWSLGRHAGVDEWLSAEGAHGELVASIIAGEPDFEAAADVPLGDLARSLQRQLVVTPTVEGWYALALMYEQMQGSEQAVIAARRAVSLQPDALPPRVLLARVLVDSGNGAALTEARSLLADLRGDYPDHEGVLMLTGMAAARDGDYDAAIVAWERLRARHGDDEAGQTLDQALADLRQKQARLGFWHDLQVTVEAPDDVRAGGTLFVFLRPEGQTGGQPLAARRVIAGSFPVTVTIEAGDWLQAVPAADAALVAGARYSDTPGADVAAGVRSSLVPVGRDDGTPKARLTLPAAGTGAP